MSRFMSTNEHEMPLEGSKTSMWLFIHTQNELTPASKNKTNQTTCFVFKAARKTEKQQKM